MARSVKIDVRFPSPNEAKTELDKLLGQISKNSNLKLNLDTGAFNKSLGDMSKLLDTLKGKLSNFGVIKNIDLNTDSISKATREFDKLNQSSKNLSSVKNIFDGNDLSKPVSTVNKYQESIAKVKQETVSMGNVTKTVTSENIQAIEKMKLAMNTKLNNANQNGLINPSVISGLKGQVGNISTNSSVSDVNKLKLAIDSLSSSQSGIVRLQNSISNLENSMKNSKGKYGNLVKKEDIDSSISQINKLKSTLRDLQSGGSVGSNKVTSNINSASNSLRTLETNARNSANALKVTQRESATLGSSLQSTLARFGMFTSVAMVVRQLGQEIRKATEYVKDMDLRLTNIQMITGGSSDEVKKITNDFKELGATLHATNKDVMLGAEELLRAGYDVDTSKKMMEASILGGKLSGQSTQQVSEQLIAIKNAFSMTGGEMEGVIDMLSKLDNTSATSFNEIATAIQRTAFSAQQAGTPLETLASYITTVSEKTRRSADTIGESFKTIYSRYSNIKLGNMDEDGKSINDTEKALARVGIKIREINGDFRNFDTVLAEFASKKEEMSQIDYLAGVQSLAGTRQKETLLALIENFDTLKQHQDEVANSSGNAKKMFDEAYSGSIDAKVNDLKRSFEGLYESMLNSSSLGVALDGVSGFINGISSITNTLGIIPTTIGAVIASLTMFNTKFRESANVILNTNSVIGKMQGFLTGLTGKLSNHSNSLQTSIKHCTEWIAWQNNAGKSTQGLGLNLLGLKAKLAMTEIGMVSLKVASIALTSVLTMGLGIILSGVVTKLFEFADSVITTKKELQELNKEFLSTNGGITKNISESENLIKTYNELTKSMKNPALSSEELAKKDKELLDVQGKLVEMYPQASLGLDENGKAKGINLAMTEKLIEAEKRRQETSAKKVLQENDKLVDTNGIAKDIEKYKKATEQYESIKKLIDSDSPFMTDDSLKSMTDDLSKANDKMSEHEDKYYAVKEAMLTTTDGANRYKEQIALIDDVISSTTDETSTFKTETEDLANGLENVTLTAEDAANAIKDLGSEFSGANNDIKLLEDAMKMFNSTGGLDADIKGKIFDTGNVDIIALLADYENFSSNAGNMIDVLTAKRDEAHNKAIEQAVIASNIQGESESAKVNNTVNAVNEQVKAESEATSSKSLAYKNDSDNKGNAESLKVKSSYEANNAIGTGISDMVNRLGVAYGNDVQSFSSAMNSKQQIAIDGVSKINRILASMTSLEKMEDRTAFDPLGIKGKKDPKPVYVPMGGGVPGFVPTSSGYVPTSSNYVPTTGSGNKADKEKKEKEAKKDIEDKKLQIETNQKLKDSLDDINDALEVNRLRQENATGTSKKKLMDEEIVLLKSQLSLQKQLENSLQSQANIMKNDLSKQGVKFDSASNISNYEEILKAREAHANSLTGQSKEDAIKALESLEKAIESYRKITQDELSGATSEWHKLNNEIQNVYKEQAELIAQQEQEVSKVIINELDKRHKAKVDAINKAQKLEDEANDKDDYENELKTENKKLAELQANIDRYKNRNDAESKLLLKQAVDAYDEQQRIIDEKIKENQRKINNNRYEIEKELADKELEDAKSNESMTKLIGEALSTGFVTLGGEVVEVNTLMKQFVLDTNVGMTSISLALKDFIKDFESAKSIIGSGSMADINASLGLNTFMINPQSNSRSILPPEQVGKGNVTVNYKLEVKGNLTEDILPKVENMMKNETSKIYNTINDKFK